jgi:hypothetical protein
MSIELRGITKVFGDFRHYGMCSSLSPLAN